MSGPVGQKVVETITKPCANGCGREVTHRRTESMGGSQWDWVRDMALVCDSCHAIEEAERRAADEAERVCERLERRVRHAGIPLSLQAISWGQIDDDPDRCEAREAAMRWGRGELHGLTLCGEVGVGKTWMAAAAMWERLRREGGRWYSVPKLVSDSKAWGSDEERDAAQTLTGNMPLVLDDVDKVKATEWVASQLFTAIDGRYQNGGAWIVTTNLDPDTFTDRFGPALGDRLFGGRNEVHILYGNSRR